MKRRREANENWLSGNSYWGVGSAGSNLDRESQSQSQELELLYDWRFTANQFVLATSTLRLTTRIFIFQLNICGYSPYVIPSLTRGFMVYNCCWSSPAQSFSDPSPAGLMTTYYSLRFESPNLEGQVPAFIYPRNRV
jgi:hypothetical protein